MPGPLQGMRVIEIAGIGPAPFCSMMLADHGAEVIRIDRVDRSGAASVAESADILRRSRRSIAVNLKDHRGLCIVKDLCKNADALVEGFRPGVMERLGLGPELLLADNPRLVYGRVTGWGQDGPLALRAGHDINYIAVTGALHAMGESGRRPVPPLNLIGDFGAGGMMLAFGVVCAMISARATGRGQVIDCAMTDGTSLLMSMMWSFYAAGSWCDERGHNALDGGAHFYSTYETSDGRYIALGAIEPQFYAVLRDLLGLAGDSRFDEQHNPAAWASLQSHLATLFKSKTRDEWTHVLQESDACFAPVMSMAEAPLHPHNVARNSFIEIDGMLHPAPAPRYSNTRTDPPHVASRSGTDTEEILRDLGYTGDLISELAHTGAIHCESRSE